jgi:RNA polymerase sigma-70 factor (ECF subfamily)
MENPQLTDPVLADQAKKDPCLFLALYQRHYRRVYVYHLARTGNEQDAQDLTSETFLAALDSIAAYRPERWRSGRGERSEYSFAAWLFGIAHHKLADFFHKCVPQSGLEEVGERPAGDIPLEQVASRQGELTRLRQVLALLPEERADALSLRFISDLSLAEVARVMDKSEAAAKMLIYRGLQELRDRLGPAALEEL